jgi:hypothetical protein
VAQLFPPVANTVARGILLVAVVVVMGGLGLMMALPYTAHSTRQGITVEQGIQFSHEHHVGGLGIDCRYCHTSAEQSRFAGLPPTHTCMTCHSQLWTNAEMLAPVRRSLTEGAPIHWQRVHVLPDYVYFDHSIHVAKGVGCSTCHGPVDRMPQVRQVAPLTMGWCLDCHRNPAPNLRPEADIYNMAWTPPADQAERGAALMRHYRIATEHLTDCSRCHR